MKYPAYPKYKPSGVEWFGDVPDHWRSVSLAWVSRRYAGGTPDRGNELYWEDGTIPWINSGAVNQGLITEPSAYITEEGYRNSSAKWIPKGALVMALAGQGKTKGMVAQVAIETTCNQSMAAIIPDHRVIPRYLYWWLTAHYATIRNLAGGEQRDGLNLEILGSIPCPLLPTNEQHAIVNFLDAETLKLDTLLAKKRELIQKLKEKRTGLISRTVTGSLPPETARASGFNPNPKLKPSGIEWLGDIPEHWEVKLLKRIATISYGVGGEIDRSLEVGLKTISLPNIDIEGRLDLKDVPFAEVSESEKRYVLLSKGDLLFNWRNGSSDHLGKTAYFAADGEFSHVSFLLRIRFSEGSYSAFYQRLLNGYRVTGFFKHSKAGVNNTFNLSELAGLPVVCLPLQEQHAIADYLGRETATIDRMAAKVEEAIERLQEYRTALITAAVTGKIDVRGYGHTTEAA